MSFNKDYYLNLRQKLQAKEQRNVQKLMQIAFEFVREQEDIVERSKELQIREIESKKAEEKKKPKK